MADVGLDADLVLDIRQALEQTRRIERALDAATTGVQVRVTADTSTLPSAVTTAVDSADTTVVVTGEAADLTGDVTAAIDAADTTALITGDASQVTGEVTGAVDAADDVVIITGEADGITGAITAAVGAADTEVAITADSTSIDGATQAVGGLDDALGSAVGSSTRLGNVIGGLSVAAAAVGFASLVNAASELEQAVGGTSAIFGEARGVVDTFARGAAEAAGLTEESARKVTSQIGGLLQGFGFTQQEAAATSVSLAQLGADLAATFGGNPEEAVQALGAALRGEFDPLEQFGVSLNVTQANLKAVELGLADNKDSVDLNARAQASLALIMERSAQAQGQFGREVNTTAGQLERARAEIGNTAASVGATLQPVVNELISAVRADLIPTLGDLGRELGPGLVSVLTSLLPALGGFSQLLIALSPVIAAFGSVLEVIPGPVLQIVASLVLFNKLGGLAGTAVGALVSRLPGLSAAFALNASSMGLFRGGLATIKDGLSTLVGSINPVTAALVVAAAAFTAYTLEKAQDARQAAEQAAQQEKLTAAFDGTTGAVEGVTTQLTELSDANDTVLAGIGKFGNFEVSVTSALNAAGLSAEQFAEALADTEQPLDGVIDRFRNQGNEAAVTGQALQDLAEDYEQNAAAALDAGVATDQWSQRQVDAALAANTNADGSTNAVAALDQLQTAQLEAAEAAEAETQALSDQEKALEELVAKAPEVGLLLSAITTGGDRSAATLAQFALAADAAGISGNELAAVATQLGVASGPQLASQLKAVAEVINNVRDAGLGTLPSIADLAGEFDDFSLAGFRESLQEGLDAIVGFNENLALIAAEGGPRLAAAAAELGPGFAAGIADGIRNGEPQVAAEAELLLAGIEQAGRDTDQLLTSTIGPNLAVASGQVGALATTAFGDSFVIDPTGALVNTEDQLAQAGPGVANRAAELGTTAASGFTTAFAPDPAPGIRAVEGQAEEAKPFVLTSFLGLGETAAAGVETGFTPDVTPSIRSVEGTVEANKSSFLTSFLGLGQTGRAGLEAGFTPNVVPSIRAAEGAGTASKPSFLATFLGLGQSGTSGFAGGFRPDPAPAMAQARTTVQAGQGLSNKAGFDLGLATAAGFTAGAESMVGAARNASIRAADAAGSARGAASSAGYSVGSALGAGIASGIGDWTSRIAGEARQAVANAAAAARNQARISSPSKVFAEIGGQMGEGMAVGLADAAADVSTAAGSLADAAAVAAAGQLTAGPFTGQIATVDPSIAAQAAVGANAGTVITVAEGAVQITVAAGVTPGQIDQVRRAVTRGLDDVLAQRGVRAVARSL